MRNRRSGSSKPDSKTISTTDTERSLLGLFVESVRDYAILTMDAAGLITSWNIGAQRLKGYRVEEILGKPWSVFYTPEDIARGWPGEITRRAIAEGRAQDEGLRVRKDGTQFLARIVLSTVRDEHDVLRGFIEVTQDISEQRRAEKELRDSEERFRSFSQNFPGFNWIADSAGRYQFVNSKFERELRLSSKEWVGKSPKKLFSNDVARTILQSNETVLSTNAPVLLTETVTDNGVTRHFLVSKFPIQKDDETLIGGVSIDISPRIRATDELKRLREELAWREPLGSIAQLASALAHDLNNTLNGISLRLSAMSANTDTVQQSRIEKVSRLVARAANSVRRLQTFVRAHREPQLERLDLGQVIRKAVESVRANLPENALYVDLSQFPADLPQVLGLASDLIQVIAGLLLNAHDAMPEATTIEISAAENGGQIEVSVADRGTGIPIHNLEKIFEPFFTTKAEPRSGLGLSFASSVMTRLGGSIGASNRVGGGAVLMLIFPTISEGATQPPARPKNIMRQPVRRILVIDDDYDNLEGMKDALELRGYDVSISSSGAEALELVQSGQNFDSIICDIGMPDMNGWEVATRISELNSRARVFMLSGWANEVPESDPRRKLVVDVLAKPIDVERIDGILQSIDS